MLPAPILNHFKKHDPVIFELLQKLEISKLDTTIPPSDYFQHLAKQIIGQQLSIKAADTIVQRFEELFENRVEPQYLEKIEDSVLRQAGLSVVKVSYLRSLAEHVLAKKLDFNHFPTMSNQQIAEQLLPIRGIGPWTVQMFLLFTMGREDVFSPGDLGVRKGMERVYQQSWSNILPKLELYEARWRPYQSYVCLALWKSG